MITSVSLLHSLNFTNQYILKGQLGFGIFSFYFYPGLAAGKSDHFGMDEWICKRQLNQ